MEYDSFIKLVKNRRSIRSFKPDPIPDEYVKKIIEAACWAPSGFNMQPWEFVVVKKPELKESIAKFVKDSMNMTKEMEASRESWQQGPKPAGPMPPLGIADAPVFILLFGDIRTRVGLPMIHRFNEDSWNRTFMSSLASAFLYMHLAATTLGLASQWMSMVSQPLVRSQIKELLGIPMALQIYDMMVLGYSDMEPKPKMMRPMEEVTHYDYCGEDDFRSDEEVKDHIYRFRNPDVKP
jgi:nitroreductase